MPKPSFICIGGQRCGTTRLHRVLNEHPDIQMTIDGLDEFNKEIHYFDQFVIKQPLKWYETHFSGHKVSGEITPAYSTLSKDCVRLVGNYLPLAKIIYIVRNPVDRIWSQIRMMKTSWRQNNSDFLDFPQLVSLFDSPAVELRSDYLQTYLNWTSVYNSDNFLILTFDELLSFDGLIRLFRFLGIADDWIPSDEVLKPILASPILTFPEELRWLSALKWLDMLKKFSEICEPASHWIDEMSADKNNMPSSFLTMVSAIRLEQLETTRAKWNNSNNHQTLLASSLFSRLKIEE